MKYCSVKISTQVRSFENKPIFLPLFQYPKMEDLRKGWWFSTTQTTNVSGFEPLSHADEELVNDSSSYITYF